MTTGDGGAPAPRRVAITGAHGFLGWHTACRLRALHGLEAVRLGREDLASPDVLDERLAGVDAVIHLAGMNRGGTEDEVERANRAVAEVLAAALARALAPVHVVHGNSVHSACDTAYGRGKAAASQILRAAALASGGTMTDVLLPNVFGEHGRPAYNSFVATFCHAVVSGNRPLVTEDRQIPLLHAQQAARFLVDAALCRTPGTLTPPGRPVRIGTVLEMIDGFHRLYAGRGEIPALDDPFSRDLFNTYRSHLSPVGFPFPAPVHADARGELIEAVRAHGGTGQTFVSTTVPGATRGDHYHLHKVERFLVLRGEAEIVLRRLYHHDLVRLRVSGERPVSVDMPTMWPHRITNVGSGELVTLFWTDQLLDHDRPDQYPEAVEDRREARP